MRELKHYTLDLGNIYTREALHYHLKRDLDLSSYYGRNLDALMECLTDMRQDSEIEILNLSELMDNLGEYAQRTLAVFHRACFENRHLTLIFRESEDK